MKALRFLLQNLVGPASVMAAGSMGAGAVATLILAGAWFRYELLWVVLFMLPLFVIRFRQQSAANAGTLQIWNPIKTVVGVMSVKKIPLSLF
jgi:hypothetical protein